MSEAPLHSPPPPANPGDRGLAAGALLGMLTVPAPAGHIEPPVDEACHTLDLHLGQPVLVTTRMDERQQRGLQVQGHCSIVPAGAAHRWFFEADAEALLLRLTPALLRESAEAMGLGARCAELVPTVRMRDTQIERIGWLLQAEHLDGCPNGRLFSDGLATALAARLLTLQSGREPSSPRNARALPAWRLRKVVDYIEAHLERNLCLAELAGVAGFSPSHFKPLFKQAVGMSAHRFVLERRVARARERLLDGRASLADIAQETGFAHASHMARCMRRVLGLSPSQIANARR
ncbi:helix-turn-helix domain-containing protein [Luteimonas aquatica]|uniref:helix-turn-helix domain-containing protein n=1 Tax=Luteimonas aquatica TaxID=450364 RepID=UPI001F572C4C|nr:AraC family transcriptional regulator [Luteimonas aquatica]